MAACSWMDKQEAAFKGWLNAVLVPAAAEGGESDEGAAAQLHALASRRLVARLRGLLWQLYSQDAELIRLGGKCVSGVACGLELDLHASCHPPPIHQCRLPACAAYPPARSVMLKVEQRINSGQMRMRDEVGCRVSLNHLPSVLPASSPGGRGTAGAPCWPLPADRKLRVPDARCCCHRHTPAALSPARLLAAGQEATMKNVKEGARARAVLASYHPLWLRLGMEVVCGSAVAGAAMAAG